MKVVMINDCAFVGETLLKHMSPNIARLHIKRTRGLWDKTFGVAYKILKAKGDIYHAHYLLQDCYIAARLGKRPLIGHVHGSDLRAGMTHRLWGRIVRHNLRSCDKILVSTPDVLGIAKRFRSDAEYFQNPVDPEFFYPEPLVSHGGKKRVLIASDSSWSIKGTDMAVKALSRIKDEVDVSIIRYGSDFAKTMALASTLGLQLTPLLKVPHAKLNEYYWNADVVVDRFKLGSLGLVSLEAIACGRPVVVYVSSGFEEYRSFPLKGVETEESIAHSILEADSSLWKKEYDYFTEEHDLNRLLSRLLDIYNSLTGC